MLDSNPGFQVGDQIIVPVGFEAGEGQRGTRGVGGQWPLLSYADFAEMDADDSQPDGVFCYLRDTGYTYKWSPAWAPDDWFHDEALYYSARAIPFALCAEILAIDGNTLTLDQEAQATATAAPVHFDNTAPVNAALASAGDRTFTLPAGSFAVGRAIKLTTLADRSLVGAGQDETTLFSPDGAQSISIQPFQASGTKIRNLHLLGNARFNGFGPDMDFLSQEDHPIPSLGVIFTLSHNGLWTDCKVTDVFYSGTRYCENTWAYRVTVELTEGLARYVQWQFAWANSYMGGTVDCSAASPLLTGGCEAFASTGVRHIRFAGHNANMSLNSTGDCTIESPVLTVTAMSQLSADAYDARNPMINVNSNIDQNHQNLALGNKVFNPTMIIEGPINADGDVLPGVVFNAANANDVLVDGSYTSPDYGGGGIGNNGRGAYSTGFNTRVFGFTVNGATDGHPNIAVSNGWVVDCYADRIAAPNKSGNHPAP